MRLRPAFIIMSLLLCNATYANNLGVIGEVFPIIEPDLLQEIHQKLVYLQQTGQLNAVMEKMQNEAKKQIVRPVPVSGMTTTIVNHVRMFDPSIILDKDIVDAEGHVLWRKGTVVNPLVNVHLHEKLIFFNADDPKQLVWAEQKMANSTQAVKPILVEGDWSELMKKWHKPVYFDQGGHLTTRFGITHVPAEVTQENVYFRIEEDVPPA
ncbi:MAG: type-F conjugative transfer system protein TraW [Gammaproteobacteria bacterium]